MRLLEEELGVKLFERHGRGMAVTEIGREVSITDPEPVRKLVVAYPADRRGTPAARAVGAAFIEIARELADQKIWAGRMLDDET